MTGIFQQSALATSGSISPFGIYLTLVNPVQVRSDAYFQPITPATFDPASSSLADALEVVWSYGAELVISTRIAPSMIMLPTGVRIVDTIQRPRTPDRVPVSRRVFDKRVEVSPKMETVYILRMERLSPGSKDSQKVEITVLYE